jgi:hypothetical protein
LGNAYLTGETVDGAVDYPTTAGAFNTVPNGSFDVFVTKFNTTGSALDYSTFIGGNSIDSGQDIAVDAAGNAYITGYTFSAVTNYPTTAGAFDTTHNGGSDVFVTKLNTLGAALVYSTFLGGQSNDNGSSIAVDATGSVYVTGQTTDSMIDYPSTTGAFDEVHNGLIDAFVSRLNPTGSALLYSTFLGGNGNDYGEGLALDSSGNVYVTGSTEDRTVDLPTTPEAFQPFHNGSFDTFISKFGDYAIAGRTIDSTGAPISGVTVTLSGPQSGVVQSDSQGFFAFTDTLLSANFTVAAARVNTAFNPALFNINNLSGNRYLYFTGTPGAPTGYPGGMLRVYPAQSVNEYGGYTTIAIERVDVFNQNVVSIDYRTSSGTATANDDFTNSQGTITFLPLEFVKTVDVPIINDVLAEQAETFTFILSNPTGGAGLSENRITQITITDDDDTKPRKKKEKVEIMRVPSWVCFLPSKSQYQSVRRVRFLQSLPPAKSRSYKKFR